MEQEARPCVGERLAAVEDLEVYVTYELGGGLAPADPDPKVLPAGTVVRVEAVESDRQFWALPEEYEELRARLANPDYGRAPYSLSISLEDYAAGRLRPA